MTALPIQDLELTLLLDAIYRRYHYDFREYAEGSLRRRLSMALAHFDCPTLSRLQERVLHEPHVFSELLRFLTVQVSDLFRDPSYYRTIREKVVAYLKTYPSLKVWVAGCATGEEAYSFAILLHEEGLLDRCIIYATDIHPESLRVAENGVYALDRFAQFTRNYQQAGGRASLSDYYSAEYSSGVLDHRLRRAILFSDHSLATDAAFAEMELISCRNVLIYFERDLQERAVAMFRASLCRKGFLGLGTRETLRFSSHAPAFLEFDPHNRIYQRI